MAFNEAPCKCCICTSLCQTGIPIIRYSDGSYSPPSITRRIPGTDRTEVVWLNAHLNAAWGDLSCAWNLVSGSVFEQTWSSVPKGVGYASALATLGLAPDDLASLYVREAVNRILETQNDNLPDLWNDILKISRTDLFLFGNQLRGPFGAFSIGAFTAGTAESDPGPLVTREPGTLVTKSLKGCLGHVVTLDILALGRDVAIDGRTDYRNDPFTIDTLIGCDENGDSPLATLRLRMEHGKVLSAPVGPCWSPEPLSSHAMSKHKDYPSYGYNENKKMVELIGYAELLGEDGDIRQSYALPQADPYGAAVLGGAQWRVSLADGFINVMMVSGSSVHIFDTYTSSTDPRSAACVGVSFVRGKGTQVSMHHAPLTRSVQERVVESAPDALGHTTNTIVSLAPATTTQNYTGEKAPWRLNDRCEWWSKQGRVLPAIEGSEFSELVLSLDYDLSNVEFGTVSFLKMWPHGVFNLGATSDNGNDLIDNTFWFAEDMQDEFSGPYVPFGGIVSGTIGRVEWSATIQWFTNNSGFDMNQQRGNLERAGDNWATLTLIGRCDRTISLSPGVTESLFAYSRNAVGKKFFSGDEVDLQWQWGWTAEAYGLPVAPYDWGYPVRTFEPKKFTAKLV